jgi:hypothetical protein
MKKTILLAIFSLFFAISVFGQAKTISSDEYYKAYREAYKKFQDTPVRRETSKEEHYKEGKLNGTTETITEQVSQILSARSFLSKLLRKTVNWLGITGNIRFTKTLIHRKKKCYGTGNRNFG